MKANDKKSDKPSSKQKKPDSCGSTSGKSGTKLKQPKTKKSAFTKPEFSRDIAKYMLSCYVILISHIIYQFNGNLLIPMWLIYLVNLPIPSVANVVWGLFKEDPNIEKKDEKAFQDDRRFNIPLYMFWVCDFITWFWCLLVTSDKYDFEGIPLLENKIESAG